MAVLLGGFGGFGGVGPAAADVLVGNLGQIALGASDTEKLSLYDFAQGFTTGANITGYRLQSISIDFNNAGLVVDNDTSRRQAVYVYLQEDDGNDRPNHAQGGQVATLTRNGVNFAGPDRGVNKYTVWKARCYPQPPHGGGCLQDPSSVHLDPNTKYWIYVWSGVPNIAASLNPTVRGQTGAAGWTINGTVLTKPEGSAYSNYSAGDTAMRIQVEGKTNPAVNVSISDVTVTEGVELTADFVVSLSQATSGPVTMDYVTVSGTASGGVTDYGDTNGSLTIMPGETRATISVPILDDAVAEGDETFELVLSNLNGATFSQGRATATIQNAAPLTATISNATAHEGTDDTIDFTISLNRATNRRIEVGLLFSSGTATSADITQPDSDRVTFDPGETQKTYSFGVVDDETNEPSETFSVILRRFVGDDFLALGAAGTGTITNTERLEASFSNVPQDHDGTSAFTFNIAFTKDVSISAANMRDHAFTVTGGDVDSAAKVNGRSKQWLITVDPDGDDAVTITLPGNRACTTTGAICTNEDNPVQLGNSPSATVAKAAGTPLTASFSNLPTTHTGADFTFDLAFTDELAAGWRKIQSAFKVTGGSINRATRKTKGSDLNWRIKVRPRNATDSLTITLPATLQCSASGAICTDDGRRLSNTTTATVATKSEEAATTPTINIADGNGTEGTDSSITFTVTLDEAATETVTVDYATSDGTATAGDDYTSKSGTLSFDAGTTSQSVSVPIADDETDESDETFTVTLSNASGADLGTSSATGTIRNRLVVLPKVSISGGSGKEGEDDEIDFTVTLDKAASGSVTVDYATADGTASAGDDYTATSGTLTFSADQTSKTLSVSIADDVENESDETFTVTLSNASGADLGTKTASGTIENRKVEPLTARFEGMPTEHDGGEFTFELHFSENAEVPFRRLRDRSFTLVEADIPRVQRLNPQAANKNQSWTITVEPDGNKQIGITLPAAVSCTDDKSICTHDGRKLSQSTSATVEGPVGISVDDVEVVEGANVVLAFAVSLTRAATSSLTIDYATSDGTATAGSDYTSTSGTLTIGAGSSSGSIEVAVLDDEHNEGSETMTLTLSSPSSGVLTDSSATGTITNHDALPAALVARFGRTAALHIVEMVEERVDAPRAPGFDGRVAGQRIHRDMGQEFALGFLQQLGGGYAGPVAGMPSANGGMTSSLGPQGHMSPQGMQGAGMQKAGGPSGGLQGMGMQSTSLQGPMGHSGGLHQDAGFGFGMGGRDQVLQGSGFALNRATKTGGVLSFWSRSAQSSFYGQDGALALNGDVRSTMFGADYSKGRMVTGVSLSHSRGLGGYAGGADTGRMTSLVTGLYPWIGFKASERVTVWTVAGYGAGGLLLSPGGSAPIETGLSMGMAAGGGRGELMTSEAGFELAFKADALWVGTRTDAASGPSGNLVATRAGVTRLRTALEGSKSTTIARRMALTPSIELGVRQDGGDAEVGRGLDVGVGLVLADAVSGLAVDVRIRRLLVHQATGFAENGMSVSVSYDPSPKTPLGFTARVAPAWGGDSMSGANALWGRETMGGMGQNHLLGTGGNRLDTEMGYGLPLGARFVGTPRVGVRTSEYGRDYRLGYEVEVLEQGSMNLQLGIDAERRESPVFHLQEGSRGADQRVLGHASVQW